MPRSLLRARSHIVEEVEDDLLIGLVHVSYWGRDIV
jgi:hypothetical protein